MRRLLVLCLLVALGACSDDEPRAQPSPTASPSPTPSPGPQAPGPDPLESLPQGPPPTIAYAEGGAIVHPDGRREVLPGQRRIGITAFTRFRDGWIVADGRIFEGTVGLAYVAGRTRRDLGPCASGGAVLSDDGSQAAWLSQTCPESGLLAPTLVHVGSTSSEIDAEREVTRVTTAFVRGFVGDEVVLSGWDRRVDLVGPGGVTRPLRRLRWANDTCDRRGLVAGLLHPGRYFGAVVDATNGAALWRRRHTEPEVFSPDCRIVVGRVLRRSALLDADTGATVALLQTSRLAFYNWAWEDSEHLLATTSFGDRTVMVRVDLTGHVTRVGPIRPSSPYGFVLETR